MSEEVALIGTRSFKEISGDILDLYKEACLWCASKYKIKTGAAKGADQIAIEYALKKDADIHLYLPWKTYEQEYINEVKKYAPSCLTLHIYNERECKEWKESVAKYHPNIKALSKGAYALHARNFPIIKNSSFVIALSHPTKEGGTEQGIRIAKDLKIPVYNLKLEEDRSKLCDLMK